MPGTSPDPPSQSARSGRRREGADASIVTTQFVIVAVFALLQQEDLRDRFISLLGSDDLHRTTVGIDDAARRLSRYFLAQLSLNFVFGVVIGIGLIAVGVPNPILFGSLAALLRFVPYVGSLIAALLPMALAAAVDPNWSLVFWTAGLFIVVESITGQITEPMIYGHSTGLSPFSVVVAAIFWSWLWGPVGLVMSTPLTLCLVVMGRHVTALKFLDVMLSDRSALTAVESFYQRVMAGDADEAEEHAELLLKHMSLANYYDEVAIKGLRLAANDSQNGVLDRQQLDRVKTTFKDLLHRMGHHDDVQPAGIHPVRRLIDRVAGECGLGGGVAGTHTDVMADADASLIVGSPVMCIAGCGPMNGLAMAMLVQLLGKRRVVVEVVTDHIEQSQTIASTNINDVRSVCVLYLDLVGSSTALRNLVEQLRQRLPGGVPIEVGLWRTKTR